MEIVHDDLEDLPGIMITCGFFVVVLGSGSKVSISKILRGPAAGTS